MLRICGNFKARSIIHLMAHYPASRALSKRTVLQSVSRESRLMRTSGAEIDAFPIPVRSDVRLVCPPVWDLHLVSVLYQFGRPPLQSESGTRSRKGINTGQL